MQAIIVPKAYLARGKCHYPSEDLSESMSTLKIKEEPKAEIKPVNLAAAFEAEDAVGVEVADSDEERADPEAEYSAAAEPDAPLKGRKKVVKK